MSNESPASVDDKKFLRLVKKLVKRHSNLADVSEVVSPSGDRSWLSKALLGHRPFTFRKLEQVLAAIEVEPDEFWAEFVSTEIGYSVDTAGRLLQYFGGLRSHSTEPEPEILQRLDAVLPVELVSSEPGAMPRRFDYVVELLGNDRQVALAEAETWLLDLWARRLRRRSWTANETTELCAALAAWAAVTRSLGNTRHAGLAIERALRLHVGATLTPSFGLLLEVAARVLTDLGLPSLGFDCLREALSLYSIYEEKTALARTKISIGLFATYRGMFGVAESALLQCTEADDIPVELRNTAIKNLSWSWLMSGQLNKAKWLLGRVDRASLPTRTQFNLEWVEALVLTHEGNASSLQVAAEKYRALLEEAEEHLVPANRLLLFMDFSECCFAAGRAAEAIAQAPIMTELAKDLEETPLAKELAIEMLSSLRGSLAQERLNNMASRYRKALQPGAASTQPI